MAISDGGANATLLFGDGSPWQCTLQAVLQQFFSVAAILWSFMIALTMYAAVVLRAMRDSGGSSQVVAFTETPCLVHAFVWGFSLLCCLPPLLITNNSSESKDGGGGGGGDDDGDDGNRGFRYYGPSDHWCWIELDNADDAARFGVGDWLRFATFYGVVWLAFFTSTFCYCSVYLSLRGVVRRNAGSKDAQTEVLLRLMRTLKYYPLIFLASWLPNSTFRVMQSSSGGRRG